MTDDKPLHVRVAAALGCKMSLKPHAAAAFDPTLEGYWECECPFGEGNYFTRPHGCCGLGIFDYSTDWSETGPLIELYSISLAYTPERWWAVNPNIRSQEGPTPLIAVCNLILALKETGRLKGQP
jgi:hypothetical protein